VAGQGIAQLRAEQVDVDVGTLAMDATEAHAGFFSRVHSGRPLVRAKYAMTLDGRIATRTRDSRWITGPAARRYAHRLRDRSDAILVGSGTVRADDPALTVRLPEDLAGYGGPRQPLRVIVDGRGASRLDAQVFSLDRAGTTLVATTEMASEEWLSALHARHLEYIICGGGPRVDLAKLLQMLGERGMNDVMVESGGQLLGALFDAGLIDRITAFIAPVIAGGADAPGPIAGRGHDVLANAPRLSDPRWRELDGDIVVEGTVPVDATPPEEEG
jgi:diaminohydroxyphosphoribosylaminopyrimidine deaminase/5-amino-6-(5-phosphoribosylamino)uracil reductase